MGMVLCMTTLGDDNIAKVLADPPLIWKVLAAEDPESYERERNAAAAPGLLGRLFGKKPAPRPAAAETGLQLGAGEGQGADLDKSWHGIHYLLTGSAWEGEPPLNFLVSGGEQVGEVEVGYGPARVLSSAKVQALHQALAGIDEACLRGRFNPAEMMRLQIYPAIWDRDPARDDAFGYCLDYFGTLKAYVADAAGRRLGMAVYLS
jgi:hypothetical protein